MPSARFDCCGCQCGGFVCGHRDDICSFDLCCRSLYMYSNVHGTSCRWCCCSCKSGEPARTPHPQGLDPLTGMKLNSHAPSTTGQMQMPPQPQMMTKPAASPAQMQMPGKPLGQTPQTAYPAVPGNTAGRPAFSPSDATAYK